MASEDTGITTSGDRTIGERDQFDTELSREDAAFSSVHTGSRSDVDLTLFRPADDGAAVAPIGLAVPEQNPDAAGEPLPAMTPEVAPSGAGLTGTAPEPSDYGMSADVAALTANPALPSDDADIAPVSGGMIEVRAFSGFWAPSNDSSAAVVVTDTGPVGNGAENASDADSDGAAGGGDTVGTPDPVDLGTPDAPGGGQTEGQPSPVAPHPPADAGAVPDSGAPTGEPDSENDGEGPVGGTPGPADPQLPVENPAPGVPGEGNPAGPDETESGTPGAGNAGSGPDGGAPADTGSVPGGDADGGASDIPNGTDQPKGGAVPAPIGGDADEVAQPGASSDGGSAPEGDGAVGSGGVGNAPVDGHPTGDGTPEDSAPGDAASGGADVPGDSQGGENTSGGGAGDSPGAATPETDSPPSDGTDLPGEGAGPVTEPGSTDSNEAAGGSGAAPGDTDVTPNPVGDDADADSGDELMDGDDEAADGSGEVPRDIGVPPSPVANGAEDGADANADSGDGQLDGGDETADGSAPGGSAGSGSSVGGGEANTPAQNPVAGDGSGTQADGAGDGAAADAGSGPGNEMAPDVPGMGEGPSEGETGLPGGADTEEAAPDDGSTGAPDGDGSDPHATDGSQDGGLPNPGTGADGGGEPLAPAGLDEPVHSGGGTGSGGSGIVPDATETADPGDGTDDEDSSGGDGVEAAGEAPGGGASPTDPVAEEPAPVEGAQPADGLEQPASTPILSVSPATGAEDAPVLIDLTIDADAVSGIEAVVLSGVPAGATFSAGTDTGGGTWTVAAADLDGLAMTPPQDFAGDFALGAQVIPAGGTPGEEVALPVSLAPVADAPLLTIGLTELARPVVVSAAWSNPGAIGGTRPTYLDGGQVNTGKANDVVIVKGDLADNSNIHLGAGDDLLAIGGHLEGRSHFNAGTGTDRVELGLPSSNFEIINLVQTQGRIHGKLTDLTTGGDIVINHVETITFGDGLVIGNAKGLGPRVFEPGARSFDVDITASLTDTDGSESLSVAATSLPMGAVLSAGSQDASGAWQLSLDDLGDLTMTLAPGHAGPVAIEGTATAREIDAPGETASVVARVTPGQTAHGLALDIADLAHVEGRSADTQQVWGPQAAAAKLALDELVTAVLSDSGVALADGAAFDLGGAALAPDLRIDDLDDLPSLHDAMA